MSKYEDIVQVYSSARKDFLDNKIACSGFARELVADMIDYFEWPQDREVTYIPLDEDLDPNNKFYAIAGAMRLDDDAFWHFGLALNLAEISGINPLSLVFSFFIKQSGTNFKVRMGIGGRELTIPASKRGDALAPFYDLVFNEIDAFLKAHLVHVLAGKKPKSNFITVLAE